MGRQDCYHEQLNQRNICHSFVKEWMKRISKYINKSGMGKLVGLLDALLCGLDGDKLIENCSMERVVKRCLTRHIPYQWHVIVFPRLGVSEKKMREISEAVGEMPLEKKKAAIYFE
ncbi:conserved hypothetical protein [Trichinella spiralis]|nr:conserved hypothetical protein [Trichinella spiralis]